MINTFHELNKFPHEIDVTSEEYLNIKSKYVVITMPETKIVKDFHKWVKSDKSIGMYFSDYVKQGLPIYHVDLPKHVKKFPFLVIPKDKLDEAIANAKEDPIAYLRSKYIVSHIPELICEVQ